MNIFKFIAGYIYTQIGTTIHKLWVLRYIVKIINEVEPDNKWELYKRGLLHDVDKYKWGQAKYFAILVFKIKGMTYGSKEYYDAIHKTLKPAIDRHYKINRHHPEYYKNGIKGMSETDKLEMLADWTGATKRHKNGNIFSSLEKNQKRFGYSDEEKEKFKSIIEKIL